VGSEFIQKAAPACKKAWDRGRVRLSTPGLFTHEPLKAARTIAGEIVGQAEVCAGDGLTVEPDAGGVGLVARRGLTEVLRFHRPPAAILQAVKESCGVASGRVEYVHDLAGVAEVSLC
jgi:hypothetical protein